MAYTLQCEHRLELRNLYSKQADKTSENNWIIPPPIYITDLLDD